jgi:hypothetical protein
VLFIVSTLGVSSDAQEIYALMDDGHCDESHFLVVTKDECETAAKQLGLADTTVSDASGTTNPVGCYYKNSSGPTARLWLNTNGVVDSTDTTRRSICSDHEWVLAPTDSGLIYLETSDAIRNLNSYSWDGLYSPSKQIVNGKRVWQKYKSNKVMYWGAPPQDHGDWGKCWIIGTSLQYRSLMNCDTSAKCLLSESPAEAVRKCDTGWMVYSSQGGWTYLESNALNFEARSGEYPAEMFQVLNGSSCASHGSLQDLKEASECGVAATFLGLSDRVASVTNTAEGLAPEALPYGCYTDLNLNLWFNPVGTLDFIASKHNMTSLCKASSIVLADPIDCRDCDSQEYCCMAKDSDACTAPTGLCKHAASTVVFGDPLNKGDSLCQAPQSQIVSVAQCEMAAKQLFKNDTKPEISYRFDAPLGCYYKSGNRRDWQLFFNVAANVTRSPTPTRVSLCASATQSPATTTIEWILGIAGATLALVLLSVAARRQQLARDKSTGKGLSEPLLNEELEMRVRAVIHEEHESRSREPSTEVIAQLARPKDAETDFANDDPSANYSKFEAQTIRVCA